tara:strand:+ start:187 stop:417 length:231 start_codon:yes stop_codon:yes gene_type:complete
MPRSKNNTTQLDHRKLGQTYYNILDVSSQKITERIIENSNELGLTQETIRKLSEIVNSEIVKTKDWGYDILSKNLS